MQRLIRFLWYAQSTRQVVEQNRAHGLFCQNTALQCSHSEATTFLYCDFNSTPSLTHFSIPIPSGNQNGLLADTAPEKQGIPLSKSEGKVSRFTAYAGSMMKVPSRIFIATVLPARPFVFLRTRHFISVVEVFHIPRSTLHEFSRLPDSFPS
jgi:hypothetical protein